MMVARWHRVIMDTVVKFVNIDTNSRQRVNNSLFCASFSALACSCAYKVFTFASACSKLGRIISSPSLARICNPCPGQ